MIAQGNHTRDTPPKQGGRWPVSVVLRPPTDSPLSRTLDQLTKDAAALANGPADGAGGHWQTGQLGSAHLTVRALELYRPTIDPDEPAIKRYLSAMERAATGPARIEVTGLTLTRGTVMACAVPLDDQADLFMDRLKDELGDDAWHELPDGRRDIWYLNLLHFTTDIPDPGRLIDWVQARRETAFGDIAVDKAELVRFHHVLSGARPHMHPETLGYAELQT